MAIEDLIAQGIRPPQVEQPIEAYGKILTLKNLVQQQQMGKLQMQSEQLGLQEKQQDFQDQQTIRHAYMESGGDLNKFNQLIQQRGVNPKTMIAIQQQQLAMKKSFADMDKVTLENDQSRHDQLRGELKSFMGQSQAYKEASWQPWIQQHVQTGRLTPQEGQQLLQQYPQYPGDEQGKLYANGLATASQLMKEENESRTSAARQLVADTGKTRLDIEAPGLRAQSLERGMTAAGQSVAGAPSQNQEEYTAWRNSLDPAVQKTVPAFFSPAAVQMVERQGMTSDQRATVDQATANLANTKSYQAAELGNKKVELGQGQQRLNLENKRFDATLGAGLDANGQPLSPAALKEIAQRDPVAVAISEYLAPDASVRSPLGKATMAKVYAIDPKHDGTTFAARNTTARAYAAGGEQGKQITSGDTALAHLDTLSRAGKALDNGDLQILNQFANNLGAQIGATPKQTYDAIVAMVAPELSKAVIGAAGGEGERSVMGANFAQKLSTPQREGVIGAVAQLLGARYEKTAHAYESDMGKPLARKLSPESQAVLDRYKPTQQAAPGAPVNPFRK